jgi:pimeloyl-ACP methyl ester carboxylesterase
LSLTLALLNGHLVGDVALTADPSAVVLFVHGFGSDRKGTKAAALAQFAGEAGISFAAFDFRGHGESSGTMFDLRASQLQEDLDAIAGHLIKHGANRLYLVGSSMGGLASAWFAKRRPEVVAGVVLIAPALGFLRNRALGLSEEQKATPTIRIKNQWLDVELDRAFLDERTLFEPDTLAKDWKTRTLIFHGMNDAVVPWRESLDFVQQVTGDVELRLLRNGDHRLNDIASQLAEATLAFVKKCEG